jgi:hypothetical protein
MAARRPPFLPTSLETILLSIYPATLVAGSLFALLDPSTRSAPYNATTQSHFADTAPSYFAKKSNIFNVFFVKQGWAWITISYFFFLFTHPSTGPPGSLVLTPKRIRGALRWTLVTVWWIFVTQWFFGPAIIDRSFLLTGGQCELVEQAEAGNVDMDPTRQFVTGVACKAVGGKWRGGHDISGHVFLLVLGSMFLLEEVVHVILRSSAAKEERTIIMDDGAVKSADVEAPSSRDAAAEGSVWTLGVKIILGVVGLSLYMLLMTAAYFHTWFEKVRRGDSALKYMLIPFLAHWLACGPQWHICCIFLTTCSASGKKRYWHAGSIEITNDVSMYNFSTNHDPLQSTVQHLYQNIVCVLVDVSLAAVLPKPELSLHWHGNIVCIIRLTFLKDSRGDFTLGINQFYDFWERLYSTFPHMISTDIITRTDD